MGGEKRDRYRSTVEVEDLLTSSYTVAVDTLIPTPIQNKFWEYESFRQLVRLIEGWEREVSHKSSP
jgi:hypothetical protein